MQVPARVQVLAISQEQTACLFLMSLLNQRDSQCWEVGGWEALLCLSRQGAYILVRSETVLA